MTAAPAWSHDWFTGLRSPSGEKCCNGRDCQLAEHRYRSTGHGLEVGIEGMWLAVDPATVVATPSIDGRTYACFERRWRMGQKMPPVVRCVILPGEV